MQVVEGYHAKINPDKVGLSVQAFVFISLALKQKDVFHQFIQKVREIPEVVECHIITGEADVILKVICQDKKAYEDLLFNKLSQIGEVDHLKTQFILSTAKDSKVLPLDYGKPRRRNRRKTATKT